MKEALDWSKPIDGKTTCFGWRRERRCNAIGMAMASPPKIRVAFKKIIRSDLCFAEAGIAGVITQVLSQDDVCCSLAIEGCVRSKFVGEGHSLKTTLALNQIFR